MKSYDIHVRQTAKFIAYVLGRHPDEFGLLPDPDGYVSIKTLLKAVHEEPGWRHLRKGHLNALILNLDPAPIEILGNMVRAADRAQLPVISTPAALPKILYTAVRQRAYPMVREKGIHPAQGPYVILASDPTMAERLGRRIDNHPVLLTVQVPVAQNQPPVYLQYGQNLFLTAHVPVGRFSGPKPPKEKPREPKRAVTETEVQPKTPGSYFPGPEALQASPNKADKAKHPTKKRAWQVKRRKDRKQKFKNR